MGKAGNLGMPCPCSSLLALVIFNSSRAQAPRFVLLCNYKECSLGRARWKYKVPISPPSLLTADSSAQYSHHGQLQSFRSYGRCRTALSREFSVTDLPHLNQTAAETLSPGFLLKEYQKAAFPQILFSPSPQMVVWGTLEKVSFMLFNCLNAVWILWFNTRLKINVLFVMLPVCDKDGLEIFWAFCLLLPVDST